MADELRDAAPAVVESPRGEPLARLAASQLKRVRRIVDSAVALAEKGGFDAVRLRDVADASGVALGTLYKYFRSKEDILLFAVNEEAESLEQAIAGRPAVGETQALRLHDFFQRATRGFVRRPDFARAVLRAIASGTDANALQVASFHVRMTRMVVAALRGEAPDLSAPLAEPVGTEREREIALILQHVWFAALVGWAGGLHPVKTAVERVCAAAALILNARSE
jgi:AcrR family transcriptional regulator